MMMRRMCKRERARRMQARQLKRMEESIRTLDALGGLDLNKWPSSWGEPGRFVLPDPNTFQQLTTTTTWGRVQIPSTTTWGRVQTSNAIGTNVLVLHSPVNLMGHSVVFKAT